MFWFGDLNFRIESLDIRFVKYAIDSNILSQLWEKDQVGWMGVLLSLGWALSGVRLCQNCPHSCGTGHVPSLPMGYKEPCLSWPCGEGVAQSQDGLYGRWAHAPFTSVLGRAGGIGSMDLLLAWHGQTLTGLAAMGQG